MNGIFLLIALFLPLFIILLSRVPRIKSSRQIEWIVEFSRDYALKLKFNEIGTDLFIYAIVKNEIGIAFQILKSEGFKIDEFIKDIEVKSEKENENNVVNENTCLSDEAEKCLVETYKTALKKGNKANSAHLLIAVTLAQPIVALQNKYHFPSIDAIEFCFTKPEFAHQLRLEKPISIVDRIKRMIKISH